MKKDKDKKVKDNTCDCGCEEKDCHCDEDCDCGCADGKDCTCDDDCHCGDAVFDTENDLNVAIIKNNKDLLLNENCCTCINIMLSNDGRILTSFLGCHNPYIVEQLEKAQKLYFKSLKKALKKHYFSSDDECDCGCADGKDCTCGDDCGCNDSKCNCSPDCTCGCQEGKECTCDGECHCDDNCDREKDKKDCGCGGKKTKKQSKKK